MVAAKLGASAPRPVAGIHVNFVTAPPPREPGPEDARARSQRLRGRGAARTPRTRSSRARSPTRSRSALTDSPAGLAAWIVEKFRRWSDCDGDVERAFSKDVLLTNLMIYWAPGSTASAARIYRESAADPEGVLRRGRVEVPVALRGVPARDRPPAAALGRAPLQRRPLDGHAARRPLRRARGAGAAPRRRPGVLPGAALVAAVTTRAAGRGVAEDRGDDHGPRWRAGSAHGPCRRG